MAKASEQIVESFGSLMGFNSKPSNIYIYGIWATSGTILDHIHQPSVAIIVEDLTVTFFSGSALNPNSSVICL